MEFRRANPSLLRTVTLLLLSLCVHGLAQTCEDYTCLNGGTCQDTPGGVTCHCPVHPVAYTGRDCGLLYNACAEYKCPKTHLCNSNIGYSEYECICQDEFNCTNKCVADSCTLPNSQCIERDNMFICQCQIGYLGTNCQERVSECAQDPCQNNGTCLPHPGGYKCVCEPGFTGQDCEVNVDECASNPCQNEAICVDKINKYLCFCVPGFQGYHCEIDINECGSRPCQNNGSCINGRDQYKCACAIGYTGVNCEMEINECESNPCQNGATCRDHIGFFSCDCPKGYEGELCQHDIDECQSQPCQNGGRCVDAINRFQCDCSNTGFVGDYCELDIPECISNPCLNNATCLEGVKGYNCSCWPGYSGAYCDVDNNECDEEPCENGALCLERSKQTYYGTEHEFSSEFSYSQAAGYVCRCQPGFTGENCSVNINECEPEPCQNGALCKDLVNGFECECALGFSGVRCTVNIDDCESNPCKNGAICEDRVADYFCRCPAPALDGTTWGGKHCSVKLVGCMEHSCQNKAVCIPGYDEGIHSYTCQCQPGFYGDNCSISTTFSFSSNGYIIYDLHAANRSKRGAEEDVAHVAMRFKTTLPDMVLMYRGDENNFLLLELYNGSLYSRYKLNGRTGHLINNQQIFNDGQWHKVEVSLDTSLVMTVDLEDCSNSFCYRYQWIDTGYDSRHYDSFNTVYIGGLVQESLLSNTKSHLNFTGCLEDLKIDFMIQLPQNADSGRSFEMELGCNKTEWCHPNPCHNGALCIDRWSSFRCECIRPFRGSTCMHEYTPGTFFREGSPSYASFTVNQQLGDTFSVSGFIRTLKSDGLLLQIRNDTKHYFNIYLQNSWVHIETHSAPPLIFKKSIDDGRSNMINISVRKGLVTVTYLQKEVELGKLPLISIAEGDKVYVGGLPSMESMELWGGYFKGCLQDVRLNNYHLEFFPLEESVQEDFYIGNNSNVIQDCVSDDVCHKDPCRNKGTCTVTWNDFSCSCPANFTGRTCEEPVWCEQKPCPAQTICQDVPKGYVCLANATFLGYSSVVFAPNISEEQDLTSISLDFRTRDREAVLLQALKDMDFILIAIHDGYLQIKLQSGNNVEGIQFDEKIDISDASWHRVVITMEKPSDVPSRWLLQLDNKVNMTLHGSAGSLNFLREDISIVLAENYTGCLGQVTIGGIYLPFTDLTFPQQEQFIKKTSDALNLGCRGADVCSEKPCLHDGKCQDLFNTFSCACKTGWEGHLCELNIDDCKSNPCIHGSCADLEADYQCSCVAGYTGRNCESNVDDCQHHLCLNGGSCVDGIDSYSCKCPSSYAGPHCQWPFPPQQCDTNFTCLNGGKCNSGIWGANCTCRPGFKGRRCEVNINDCESSPCLNGGTCQDSVNNYKCICNSSFSGVHCEKSNAASMFPFPFLGVAVPVTCGVLLLFIIGVIFMVLTARKRRQSEGTYSPSQQEVAGARLEMDSVLKVPPEERLI
ncbi:protein crumbs homolog 2 [Rhinophrynus dorsalis]